MPKLTIHLICNAHLDPVWQWRWEEGCAEALSTFGTAVELLNEHKSLVFNHNEAVLYRWVQRHDRALFREIQRLVKKGRWCVSGGWYLQPDVNIPGTESPIRQILIGRKFFRKEFGVEPVVAYNFDSFGHSGGLPQILKLAGYKMYIHMRPQAQDLKLPSDLYRWRGVDGSEILTNRIEVGFYHSEYDNMPEKVNQGVELAMRFNRDVPVFWGVGNHGGGASREALARIESIIKQERRVRIVHSTTERLYQALKKYAKSVPIVEGDLQRVFTGCYTSFARVKRRAQRSLNELVQAEALAAWAWWLSKSKYPADELDEQWRDHLFNDFHDILPGSSTELAEQDALDQYGKVSESLRRLRLSAVTGFTSGPAKKLYIPLSVWTTNPSFTRVPVEVECVADLRPKWKGDWHLELHRLNGTVVECQEEQPESLMPFNWRKKIVFMAELPQAGLSPYEIRCREGTLDRPQTASLLTHTIDQKTGLVGSVDAGGGRECLSGSLMQPLVVADDGDSWGADRWRYRDVVGQFQPDPEQFAVIESGPIRTVTQSLFSYNRSKITMRTIAYASWPVMEFQLRIAWAEARKRLKLSVPTVFGSDSILCEVPGGAISRPADGEEHVQGRWCFLEGDLGGTSAGFALINSGQHGFDFKDGEIRLSVLRSAAYCHDQGFTITEPPERKYMDQGIHDVRLLVTAGDARVVRESLSGLADWLSAPPLAYAHLPLGSHIRGDAEFLTLQPKSIRLLATKRSEDERALIVRLQETAGVSAKATLRLEGVKSDVRLSFKPFEIKTIRIAKSGNWRELSLTRET